MPSTLTVKNSSLPSLFKGTILNSRARLEVLARKTRWMQRSAKKLDPIDFIHGILLAVCKGEASFRLLATAIGLRLPPTSDVDEHKPTKRYDTISKQALWERVDTEAVDLFKVVLEELLKSKGFTDHADVAPPGIRRIIVEDSSKIDLPDRLAEKFPASSNQKGHKGAGLRLQGAFELLGGKALRVDFTEYYRQDTTAAHDILPLLQRGDLVVRDLGYLVHDALNGIVEKGAHFLSRYKTGRKLYHRDDDGNCDSEIDLIKYLRRHAPDSGDHIDIDIVLGKIGSRKAPQVKCRLVAARLPDEVVAERLRKVCQEEKRRGKKKSAEAKALLGWTILITSLERDEVSMEKLIKIYELRWRVEIIFKSLKSCTPLDAIARHRSNPEHLQTLLYGWLSLVVLAIKSGAFALMKETAGKVRKLVPNPMSLLKTMPKVFEMLRMVLFMSSAPNLEELLARWLAQSEYHDRYETRDKRTNMARMTAEALEIIDTNSPANTD